MVIRTKGVREMSTYLSEAVQADLDHARTKAQRQSSRLRIETEQGYFRVLKLWDAGFAVAAQDMPRIRGLVDMYEGPRHLFQCLIVASQEDGPQVLYEFKRVTAVSDTPPRDFADETPEPIALIDAPT